MQFFRSQHFNFQVLINILVRLLTVNVKNCLTPQNPKMCDPFLVTILKMRPHPPAHPYYPPPPPPPPPSPPPPPPPPPPSDSIFKVAGLKTYLDGCVQVFRVPCIYCSDLLCFHTAVCTVHQR